MLSLHASADRNLVVVSALAWAMCEVYVGKPSWGACVSNEGRNGKKETNTSRIAKVEHHFEGRRCDPVEPSEDPEKERVWGI